MKVGYLNVHPRDLQAGDRVSQPLSQGRRTYAIERITGGDPRSGLIRWCDDGSTQVRAWRMTTHLLHLVVGGPKLSAARLHPELIDRMQNWTGGIAPEEVQTT